MKNSIYGILTSISLLFAQEKAFYLPENPNYTIVNSVIDSLSFTLNRTVYRDCHDHLVSISSFVDPLGRVMGWHDFGHLEGPGWAANAVGGAFEIYLWGKLLNRSDWIEDSLAILDHVLDCGFIDEATGFIKGYRETTTGKFCLNYKHNSDWFCPGSMAKIAFQLLCFAEFLGNDSRSQRMRSIALKTSKWLDTHLTFTPNGWYPRRITPLGKIYYQSPDGGNDPLWQHSGDGLFILQLQAKLTQLGLADYRHNLEEKTAIFIKHGGIFGSINHDTYDMHENVSYAVAFRVLLLISTILDNFSIKDFAYNVCLKGLDQFKIHEDRNGVATRGLLFMEKSWDTAYLWENAEVALAYFEAALDTKSTNPQLSKEFELNGLTILRAIAKHHYGPYGFLTEGVDWNNHVGQQHHIDGMLYGAIQYTEPFLNNQHIAEPTWFYLTYLAKKERNGNHIRWYDCEGNLLIELNQNDG